MVLKLSLAAAAYFRNLLKADIGGKPRKTDIEAAIKMIKCIAVARREVGTGAPLKCWTEMKAMRKGLRLKMTERRSERK